MIKPHVPNCRTDSLEPDPHVLCPVCHSWLQETKEAIKPLYIHIRYNRQYSQEQPQERLAAYTEQ